MAAATLASCGKPPPPKPPPTELAITGPASFAGSWVADDEMFGYFLTVGADASFLLVIDRGKLGRCEHKGALQQDADPRTYQLVLAKNTCETNLGGGPFPLRVTTFTGEALGVTVTMGGGDRSRTYRRDPDSAQ